MKDNRNTQDNILKPFCFPEMPAGTSVNEKIRPGKNVFRPIGFDQSGKLLDPQNCAADHGVFDELTTDTKKIEEQAYHDGFKVGEKEGLKSVKERLEPVLKGLSGSVVQIENAKKELLLRTEREAVELALAIAKKVVWHEVRINGEVVINVVKAALKKVVDRKRIKIRLAPSDLQFLQDIKSQIPDLEEEFGTVIFAEDESIMSGGCVIETNLGDIDARIEKQLQAVEEAFRSEFKKLRIGG